MSDTMQIMDPAEILTQREPMTSVIDAYKAFDKREPGWIKVKLEPSAESSLAASVTLGRAGRLVE